jgi:hypothetical protein
MGNTINCEQPPAAPIDPVECLKQLKIPNHGMEFFFDEKTQQWANRILEDPNDFHITTMTNQVIPIPNFYKTIQESQKVKDIIKRWILDTGPKNPIRQIGFYHHNEETQRLESDPLIPYIEISRVRYTGVFVDYLICNILTGEWTPRSYVERPTQFIYDKLYAHSIHELNERVKQIEQKQ